MNHAKPWACAAVVAVASLASTVASAADMDLSPERLVTNPGCGGIGNYCEPDHRAWARLATQYAMAIAPSGMHPARTTGYGGFDISVFGQFTTVSQPTGDRFLNLGTEGPVENNRYGSQNNGPASVLQLWGLTARKGLPYGFELHGTIGHLMQTDYAVLMGGLRVAPFEGFRKWFDVSIGGAVSTLAGSAKIKITVPVVEVHLSRVFALGGQVTLQPYVGYQLAWFFIDSGVVDATPAVDGLASCAATPSSPAQRAAGDKGDFNCQSTSGGQLQPDPTNLSRLDLNNNMVFHRVHDFRRQRLLFGAMVRYEVVHLLLHVLTDVQRPEDGAAEGDNRLTGMPNQTTFAFAAGVSF